MKQKHWRYNCLYSNMKLTRLTSDAIWFPKQTIFRKEVHQYCSRHCLQKILVYKSNGDLWPIVPSMSSFKQKTKNGNWWVSLRKWWASSRNCHCRYVYKTIIGFVNKNSPIKRSYYFHCSTIIQTLSIREMMWFAYLSFSTGSHNSVYDFTKD